MPRGAQESDIQDFSDRALEKLSAAANDLRLLLDRGYGMRESLQLVGNHFRLTKRQRQLLYRAVSPALTATARRQKVVHASSLVHARLLVDGYNALIISESCLAGGAVVLSDDGVLRDIQGVFGAFRASTHSARALDLLTDVVAANAPAQTVVYLDARMRHAQHVAAHWQERLDAAGLHARVLPVEKADAVLKTEAQGGIVATSDRAIIDAVPRVVDLPYAVAQQLPDVRVLRFP